MEGIRFLSLVPVLRAVRVIQSVQNTCTPYKHLEVIPVPDPHCSRCTLKRGPSGFVVASCPPQPCKVTWTHKKKAACLPTSASLPWVVIQYLLNVKKVGSPGRAGGGDSCADWSVGGGIAVAG